MKKFFDLVKISHTIFALPFALLGFFIGIHDQGGVWSWPTFLLVLGCMVFARNAAMAFNRLVDARFDKNNPRTQNREIPAGLLSSNAVLAFVLINCAVFIVCTYFINPICFYLSPVALIIVLGYSYCKRFTSLSHFVLGLGLSLAPVGAYLAATGQFNVIPILLGFAVLFWVAGFDIIYALQDEGIDKENNLFSVPAAVGGERALWISVVLHIICAILILVTAYLLKLSFASMHLLLWVGVSTFLLMLVYQHTLVKVNDLSKVNLAFFTFNGIASLVFGLLSILDFYI